MKLTNKKMLILTDETQKQSALNPSRIVHDTQITTPLKCK